MTESSASPELRRSAARASAEPVPAPDRTAPPPARDERAEEPGRPRPHWRALTLLLWTLVLVAAAVLAVREARTFRIQAKLLTALAERMTFQVEPGPSDAVVFPEHGPFDVRRGYALMPEFLDRLSDRGYSIWAQARSSPLLLGMARRGLFPTYEEKYQSGVWITDRWGRTLFKRRYPLRVYPDFAAVPPVVVATLLFIENRELLNNQYPHRNPVIEWDRLGAATLAQGLSLFRDEGRAPGGSTLATQLEKLRHSPDGITISMGEKFRQMASASLRAYSKGERTLPARRRVVVDYVNSVPLAAVANFGEVYGLGDGLWTWFGEDFDTVNANLHDLGLGDGPLDPDAVRNFKQVLALFIAHRRPSGLLVGDKDPLLDLTDDHLHILARAGVITPELRDAAMEVELAFRAGAPPLPDPSFVTQKAANQLRVHLMNSLGLEQVYEVDRLDLTAVSTVDRTVQNDVTEILTALKEPSYAAQPEVGINYLLQGPPGNVIYSFTLYERRPTGNFLRVQADNLDQPLDINRGVKLELGSTAKIRTLVTYLEIMAALHGELAGASADDLAETVRRHPDDLTRWAAAYLRANPAAGLDEMLEAAMRRRYSGSPAQVFYTGGASHTFRNFASWENYETFDLYEATALSVNLSYIRVLQDVMQYFMARLPGWDEDVLRNPDDPRRQLYLSRFADREGRVFLGRFWRRHRDRSPEEMLAALAEGAGSSADRLAVIFRSVRPEAGVGAFGVFLRRHLGGVSDARIVELYEEYAPGTFNLRDRGYIAGIHPLELWLVHRLYHQPGASWDAVVRASLGQRHDVYSWLFDSSDLSGQNRRIRSIAERDAFARIHQAWQRLGYPFDTLVPSFATALGSSADTPAALAELMGIIVNDGVRMPTVQFTRLELAAGTPYETVLTRTGGEGERVLPREIAEKVHRALLGVVEEGTARRLTGAIELSDGTTLPIGGKTGTGDNKRLLYNAAGQLIGERKLNRTGTFMFIIGDRFFGTVTAFVPGETAAAYDFTSALAVQVLKHLAPTLLPVVEQRPAGIVIDPAAVRRVPLPGLVPWREEALDSIAEQPARTVPPEPPAARDAVPR